MEQRKKQGRRGDERTSLRRANLHTYPDIGFSRMDRVQYWSEIASVHLVDILAPCGTFLLLSLNVSIIRGFDFDAMVALRVGEK
jgi:hypothetical protein